MAIAARMTSSSGAASGFDALAAGGSSLMWANSTAASVSRSKGLFPVTALKSRHPSAYTSERASARPPVNSSGAT